MFKDVVIKENKEVKIPKQGYYVNILWEFKEGKDMTKVGPFPEDRKDLLVEFLDILERMFLLYPHGKGGLDDFEEVEGLDLYMDYVDLNKLSKEEAETQKIRNMICMRIPRDNAGMGLVPDLEKACVIYQDGVSDMEYDVQIVMDDGSKFEEMYKDYHGVYHRNLIKEA